MKSFSIYFVLVLMCIATFLFLSQCSDIDMLSEPDIDMPSEPEIMPVNPSEPSDQNNDGFFEWIIEDTLRTEGSLYGSENSMSIDLNSDNIDDIVFTLFIAEKYDERISTIIPLHSDISLAATDFQDTLFNCWTPEFSSKYNASELNDCDTTIQTLEVINITDRVKVESFIELDSSIFSELNFKSDSTEMFYTYDFIRTGFSENFKRGDFLELGERYIYFNIFHENQLKYAYLKIRAESYRIYFLEKGIQI